MHAASAPWAPDTSREVAADWWAAVIDQMRKRYLSSQNDFNSIGGRADPSLKKPGVSRAAIYTLPRLLCTRGASLRRLAGRFATTSLLPDARLAGATLRSRTRLARLTREGHRQAVKPPVSDTAIQTGTPGDSPGIDTCCRELIGWHYQATKGLPGSMGPTKDGRLDYAAYNNTPGHQVFRASPLPGFRSIINRCRRPECERHH